MLNSNRNTDTNECISRATCAIPPAVASLEILAITFIKHTAFYLLELKKLGALNLRIQNEIINIIAGFTAVNEYSGSELYNIVLNTYFIFEEVKKTYSEISAEQNNQPKYLPDAISFSAETTQAQAISLGEKILLSDEKTTARNNLLAILWVVLQSISLNFIKYTRLKEFDGELFFKIMMIINRLNSETLTPAELGEEIKKAALLDFGLQIKLSGDFLNIFGKISKTEVSHSTGKGKAILVSGNNFSSLYKILLETKDKNIDVYSHSNLLIAHALEKFREFGNFKGHYGSRTENCILDFATFHGAILMTQNFRSNTEYLYRGRIFSNDYIVPKGVAKIENENFQPVIEAALAAKGFSKDKIKDKTPLGYDEQEIENRFSEIIEKLNSGTISKLYIIGNDALTEKESAYYENFLGNLHGDEFAITFSYECPADNVLTINTGNFTPLMSRLLNKFFDKYDITSKKIAFFATTCDVMTISQIIMLSSHGLKNIYMAECLPTMINPATFAEFIKEYNIHITTSPKKDLAALRQ